MLNDEINEKSLNLAVRVGQLSIDEIKKAIDKLISDLQNNKYSTKNITGEKTPELKHGKMTLKQLSKHNDGLSTMEMTDPNLRLLYRSMKQHNIDFAAVRDGKGKYTLFFKGKDADSIPEYSESVIARETAEALLSLWENSLDRHPYMFYMGTDFRKLKAPAMWYDIVSVVDVLSRVDSVKVDVRFIEMVSLIKSKQDDNGLFTPEAVFQKFKGWDFGQKKNPSPYLTYLCHRILERTAL